jgi:co-chaperonin GroES (HSP10)
VKQTKGGIILTDSLVGVERVMEGTGHVLRVGNDVAKTLGYGLETGMRICYRGFLKDASSMEFHPHEDGCAVFMLRAEDILAVIDADVQMGAFS